MEFFTSRDWLNRVGPYAFKLDHILFVIIGLGLTVFLALFLRHKSKKVVKITLISLWAFGTTVELIYFVTTWILCAKYPEVHPFSLEKMLPLHSCLMFMYIFPFAMFSKNKYIKTAACNFLVVVNMIMGFLTLFIGCPPVGYSALSFDGIQSMIIHIIIVTVPLIMLTTGYYDIQKRDIKFGLILFGILSVIIWTFDAIAKCDYFFFYDGHTFGVLYEISENVPHIVWTLIVVTCYVLTALIVHFFIIFLKSKIESKKDKEN